MVTVRGPDGITSRASEAARMLAKERVAWTTLTNFDAQSSPCLVISDVHWRQAISPLTLHSSCRKWLGQKAPKR